MAVKNEKELAQAVKNGTETIEIKGDLGKKVLRIKATGKVARVIAVGAIGVAVVAILATPATVSKSDGLVTLKKS